MRRFEHHLPVRGAMRGWGSLITSVVAVVVAVVAIAVGSIVALVFPDEFRVVSDPVVGWVLRHVAPQTAQRVERITSRQQASDTIQGVDESSGGGGLNAFVRGVFGEETN